MNEATPGEQIWPGDVFNVMATDAIKKYCIATVSGDDAVANEAIDSYLRQFDGTDENPLAHLTRVAIVLNGTLLRVLQGDRHPQLPPTRMYVSNIKLRGLDDEAHGAIAIEIIEHCANWRFEEIESTMEAKCTQEYGDNYFLPEFLNLLVSIFISLDGPQTIGWIKNA